MIPVFEPVGIPPGVLHDLPPCDHLVNPVVRKIQEMSGLSEVQKAHPGGELVVDLHTLFEVTPGPTRASAPRFHQLEIVDVWRTFVHAGLFVRPPLCESTFHFKKGLICLVYVI